MKIRDRKGWNTIRAAFWINLTESYSKELLIVAETRFKPGKITDCSQSIRNVINLTLIRTSTLKDDSTWKRIVIKFWFFNELFHCRHKREIAGGWLKCKALRIKQKQVTKYWLTPYPLARRSGTWKELHAANSSCWISGSAFVN